MVIRCAARLLKALGPRDLSDPPPAATDWYANLVPIGRRKCLLVVHADTLFAVFATDTRKPELSHFAPFVAGLIANALADEGLPADCLGPLDPTAAVLARTASRRVLGFMTDMALMARYATEDAGGINHLDLHNFNRFLRRNLYNRDGYIRPIEVVRERGGVD